MRVPKSLVVLGAIAVPACFLVLTSCGGGEKASEKRAEAVAEKAMEAVIGKDADVDIDGKSVKVKGEGFKTEMAETSQWPSDMFPAVPKFSFGKIERVVKGEEGGMKKFNIYLRDITQADVDRYVDLLKGAGWQADLNTMGPQGGLVAGQKDNLGINFMYSVERGDGMLAVFSTKDE